MNAPVATQVRRAGWQRLMVVELIQVPAVGLMVFGQWPWALWVAALWGSAVCCAGTDSGWRWRNRMLIAQAVVWLVLAMLLAS